MNQAAQDYLETIPGVTRRRDAEMRLDLMSRVAGQEPTMWGKSIIGFGPFHDKYVTGREGDVATVGFAPPERRRPPSTGWTASAPTRSRRVGSARTPPGVGCLYPKDLSKVDLGVLEVIVAES